MLWCPIHLFYFAKNRDVQASSRIAGKSHGYQPARCKLVIERNQPGPGVHEVLLDHQLVAVGIVFPTSHLQPTHLATWDFDAGKISQKNFTSSPSLWARRSQGAILASWQALDFTSFGVLLIYIVDLSKLWGIDGSCSPGENDVVAWLHPGWVLQSRGQVEHQVGAVLTWGILSK